MNKEKIYSGKQCEEYYKKYNLVSAVHKIIDLEEVFDKIKEKCLSIKGNPEHTIVSKNELVKQFLELLEEIENE